MRPVISQLCVTAVEQSFLKSQCLKKSVNFIKKYLYSEDYFFIKQYHICSGIFFRCLTLLKEQDSSYSEKNVSLRLTFLYFLLV